MLFSLLVLIINCFVEQFFNFLRRSRSTEGCNYCCCKTDEETGDDFVDAKMGQVGEPSDIYNSAYDDTNQSTNVVKAFPEQAEHNCRTECCAEYAPSVCYQAHDGTGVRTCCDEYGDYGLFRKAPSTFLVSLLMEAFSVAKAFSMTSSSSSME